MGDKIESRRRLRGKEDERTMTGCPFITGTPTGIGVLTGVVGADADHAPGGGRDCEGSLGTWKIEGCTWI